MDGGALRRMALAGGEQARLAFETLWKAYYARMRFFASGFRGLPAGEREDEAAEAIIAAFRALGRYDSRRPFSPWIYRIALNRFASAARRSARQSDLALGPPESGATAFEPASPLDHAALSAEADLLERCRLAIAALPEEDRRVAFLCLYEGFSSEEAVRALGMPAGTVRWRLARIRKRVRLAVGEGNGHGY